MSRRSPAKQNKERLTHKNAAMELNQLKLVYWSCYLEYSYLNQKFSNFCNFCEESYYNLPHEIGTFTNRIQWDPKIPWIMRFSKIFCHHWHLRRIVYFQGEQKQRKSGWKPAVRTSVRATSWLPAFCFIQLIFKILFQTITWRVLSIVKKTWLPAFWRKKKSETLKR